MSGKLQFTEKLRGILALTAEYQNEITLEEVEKYFEEDQLSAEQLELVCDYLLSQKTKVRGYEKRTGTVREAEMPAASLGQEEQEYLEEYMQGIQSLETGTPSDRKMARYLKKIVDWSIGSARADISLGDVIQEGNLQLMEVLEGDNNKDLDEQVLKEVYQRMNIFIDSQAERKVQDRRMVDRVAGLDAAIKEMKENYGRSVALDEVAAYLSLSEEDIADVMKLAGEDVQTAEEG